MADRFLISAAGTNLAAYWSTTSGGAGGASVPTAADNVFIDAGTPAGAKVLGALLACRTFDYSAYPTALSIQAAINFSGHWRGNGIQTTGTPITITAAATTDNGGAGWDVGLGAGTQCLHNGITWDWAGIGGRWENRNFAFNVGTTSAIRRLAGTWNTNGYAITAGSMSASTSNVKGGSAGTSIITLLSTNTGHTTSATNDSWDMTNATFDIRATANSASWRAGATIGEIRSSAAGWVHFGNPTTVTTCRRTGTASQLDGTYFGGNVTIGTFISDGNSKLNALWVRSSAYGVQRTLTVATLGSVTNTFFEDIQGAGAAAWDFSAANDIGDMGGNTGITFPPSRLLDRDNTAGAWETDARWIDYVTRAPASFPLPHDDVQLTGNGNITSTGALRLCRDLLMAAWSGVFTRTSSSATYHLQGSFSGGGTNGAAPNTFNLDLRTRTPKTIASNGLQFMNATSNLTIGVYALGASYTTTDTFSHKSTAAGASSINCVAGAFTIAGSGTNVIGLVSSVTTTFARSFNFPGVTLQTYVTGASNLFNVSSGNFSFNAAGSVYEIANPSTSARSIVCGFTFGEIKYTVADSPGELRFITAVETRVDRMNVAAASSVVAGLNTHLAVREWVGTGGTDYNGQRFNLGLDSSNKIEQPAAAALQITGDLTLDAKMTFPSWTAPGLATLTTNLNAGLTAGYGWRIRTDGKIEIMTAVGGVNSSNIFATAPSSVFNPGDTGYLRVERIASTGVCTLYTSPDGTTWTQLGATVTTTAGSLTANVGGTLQYGTRFGNDNLSGGAIMHRAVLYNTLKGTTAIGTGANVQSDARFEDKAVGLDAFTESSTNAATVSIPTPVRVNDGRLSIASSTAGTPAWISVLERPSWNYVVAKDIFGTVQGKLYLGALGVIVSGCTNVYVGTADPTAPYIRQLVEVSGSSFPFPVLAGNLLAAIVSSTTASPAWVTPAGYTVIRRNAAAGPSQIESYKRIADGSETSFTTTTTGGAVSCKCWEIVGADTVDVSGENSASAVTTVDASSAPLSTYSGKTLAIAAWGGNTIGASGAYTNGYGESRLVTLSSHLRAATRDLPASSSTNSNFSWTGNQNPRSQLLVFRSSGTLGGVLGRVTTGTTVRQLQASRSGLLGRVTVSNTARVLQATRIGVLGRVTGASVARPLDPSKRGILGRVTSSSLARPFQITRSGILGRVTTSSIVRALAGGGRLPTRPGHITTDSPGHRTPTAVGHIVDGPPGHIEE